jgi:hypothetical protein
MDFYCRFPGMKPVRQIITRSPHRTVGAIHAAWFQAEPIHHESDLEAAVIKLLLLAPTVQSIKHQAVKLVYSDGTKDRTHVPDLLLMLRDKRTAFVEVKPEKFVAEHRQKFDACAALLRCRDIQYFVCTDEHVDKVRESRANELLQLARMAAPSAQLDELVGWVRARGRTTVEDAISRGGMPLIEHAVGRRLLLTDPSLELSPGNWLTTLETADELLCIDRWLGCAPWPAPTVAALPSP